VNELASELAEEQATSTATADKIEQEMKEKQQLETQLSSFKTRCQNLETEKQQLELDLAYSISDVNGDGTPDEFNEESVYKYDQLNLLQLVGAVRLKSYLMLIIIYLDKDGSDVKEN